MLISMRLSSKVTPSVESRTASTPSLCHYPSVAAGTAGMELVSAPLGKIALHGPNSNVTVSIYPSPRKNIII